MPQPIADAEIAAFLDALPRELTYSDVGSRLRDACGTERAWPMARIRAHFAASAANRLPGRPSIIARDQELLAFVRERADLVPQSELLVGLRAAFTGRALPSRTALNRFVMRERASILETTKHG